MVPVVILLKAYKWHYLVKHVHHDFSLLKSIQSYLGGLGVGIITPGRIGEMARILFVGMENKLALSGLFFIDRFFDFLAIIIFCTVSIFIFADFSLGFLGAILIFVFLYLTFSPSRTLKILTYVFRKIPFFNYVKGVLDSLKVLNNSVSSLCLAVTFLIHICAFIQFYFLLLTFTPEVSLWVVFMFPLIIFTNLFQLTIGGLGIREYVAILLFAQFGISKAVSANVTFLIFLINNLIPGIVGFMFFLMLKNKKMLSQKAIACNGKTE